jgi:hypothetical protein
MQKIDTTGTVPSGHTCSVIRTDFSNRGGCAELEAISLSGNSVFIFEGEHCFVPMSVGTKTFSVIRVNPR